MIPIFFDLILSLFIVLEKSITVPLIDKEPDVGLSIIDKIFNKKTFICGLRFFTVYGPWGRPDMALFLFTKAILAGEKLPVFNYIV